MNVISEFFMIIIFVILFILAFVNYGSGIQFKKNVGDYKDIAEEVLKKYDNNLSINKLKDMVFSLYEKKEIAQIHFDDNT